MTASYRTWLDGHKAASKARGGRPLPFVPSAGGDLQWTGGYKVLGRERGEIFNPATGEFITGCITIVKLASELGMTANDFHIRLEALGIVHSVLDWKDVPMLCQPLLRRPEYFHRYRLTPMALEESLGLTIATSGNQPMDLITPDGRRFIRANLGTTADVTIGDQIGRTIDTMPWLSQREIAVMLGCSQQTVSRYAGRIATTKLQVAA